MADFRIVNVDAGNVEEHGIFCVKNKKHPGYVAKPEWLRERFEEGLRIKLIETYDNEKAGFLEYIALGTDQSKVGLMNQRGSIRSLRRTLPET